MRSSRVLLIVAVATGLLYMVSFVFLGSSVPTVESSGREVLDWFTDHGTNALLYAWSAAFVSLGLAVLGGLFATTLPRPHRYIVFAGVLGYALTAQVQAWFWAGLAFHPQGLDPAAARTIFDIPQFWGPIVNGSTTAMAVAIIALGVGRSPIIPRWLMWLSVVFFIEQAVETVTVFGTSGFIAPGGPMNIYLGGIIGFVWAGGLVYWSMQRLDAHAESAVADTP